MPRITGTPRSRCWEPRLKGCGRGRRFELARSTIWRRRSCNEAVAPPRCAIWRHGPRIRMARPWRANPWPGSMTATTRRDLDWSPARDRPLAGIRVLDLTAGARRPGRDAVPGGLRRRCAADRSAGLGRAGRHPLGDVGQTLCPPGFAAARRPACVRGTAGVGRCVRARLPVGRAGQARAGRGGAAAVASRAWWMCVWTRMAGPVRGGSGAASTAWCK